MAIRTVLLAASLLLVPSEAFAEEQANSNEHGYNANPIRKVVTMLQMMMNKVEAEGKKEQELYDKFMCYCKNSDGALAATIDEAETKIPQLESQIKEAVALKAQLETELEAHQTDRDAAKTALAKAAAIREKEAAAFAAEKETYDSNIGALSKAIPAIQNGMAGGFLQTQAASVLRKLSIDSSDISDVDRQELVAFLSVGQREGYIPKSAEIVGILKQMKDEMEKDVAELTATENAAISTYEELVAAKKKEIAALTKAIEEKLQRVGELGVEIAMSKNDLEDTKEALGEDTVFLMNLKKDCATKTKEWEERSKTRSEELIALSETIKILNDDDALELFKKALPSASFMQVHATSAATRAHAIQILKSANQARRQGGSPQLDFIELALQGKKVSFDKVIKLIDDMVVLLAKEQADDDHKKEYCEAQFDIADDSKKELEHSVSDGEKAIAETNDALATVKDEIKALEESIHALDKNVASSTEQRKEEHAEYSELMATNSAAKELILFAKNRMQKFYNPKLYKPPPKRELSEEERITLNMGGTLAPTNPPGGIAGTGVSALAQVGVHGASGEAPPPPPEMYGEYSKKSEESGGVLAMMDLLVQEVDKEMQEAEVNEKDSQDDYQKFMVESAERRAQDSKTMVDKEAAKAEMETQLQALHEKKQADEKELAGVVGYIQTLHGECDFLLQYYAERKEARANEVDALKKAKAVLNGADFSLMQTKMDLRSANFLGRATARKCGPNTKIHVSQSENAAGTPIFQEIEGVVDGQCMFRGNPTMKSVKFCGPGTLTLSRMSCERHDYKALTVEHPGSEWTTNCETINAEGTVVEGYFGSLTVKC